MSELHDLRLDRLEEDMRDIKPALARLEPNDCQHQCAISASGDKGRGREAADPRIPMGRAGGNGRSVHGGARYRRGTAGASPMMANAVVTPLPI
jgi:hypothetical protein